MSIHLPKADDNLDDTKALIDLGATHKLRRQYY